MRGSYRLFKQASGRTYFAEVEVELLTATTDLPAGVFIDAPADVALPSEWLIAAEAGCRDALLALHSKGLADPSQLRIRVLRLLTNWVDTTDDAIYVATYLAAAAAAGVPRQFEVFRDDRWRVRWVAS
jgi:hypothetical protein